MLEAIDAVRRKRGVRPSRAGEHDRAFEAPQRVRVIEPVADREAGLAIEVSTSFAVIGTPFTRSTGGDSMGRVHQCRYSPTRYQR